MSSFKKSKEQEVLWRIPQWYPDLSESELKKITLFHEELLKFNRTINLVSASAVATLDQMHFSDCIIGARAILKTAKSKEIFDIGAGNGLPGVILAIMDPSRRIICIERDQRKVEYLKHVATTLDLKNLEVRIANEEGLPSNSINCAVSRGFASVSKAILQLRKSFALNGEYYHMKGDTWSGELAEIPSQLCSFWRPSVVVQYKLPERPEIRAVVLTTKIQN